MGRTQAERKAGTRAQLLAAAGELFAAQGYHAVSADAVAERAERTSGALYAHFGSKEGLLRALVRELENAAVAAIAFAVEGADSPHDQLRALWDSFAEHDDAAGPWLLLEHELWLWAARAGSASSEFGPDDKAHQPSGEVSAALARRYESARTGISHAVQAWVGDDPDTAADQRATLLLALLLGLHMQRRIDPDAVSDETAVTGLELLLGIDNRTSVLSHNQGV